MIYRNDNFVNNFFVMYINKSFIVLSLKIPEKKYPTCQALKLSVQQTNHSHQDEDSRLQVHHHTTAASSLYLDFFFLHRRLLSLHLNQSTAVGDASYICWWIIWLLKRFGLNLMCCCQPPVGFYYMLPVWIYAVAVDFAVDSLNVVDDNTFVVESEKNLVDFVVVCYDVVDYDNVVDVIGEQQMLLSNQMMSKVVVHTSAAVLGHNLLHRDS